MGARQARIYARASRDAQRLGLSTDGQVANGKEVAGERGLEVVGVYVDQAISASRHTDKERPEFDRMVADLRRDDVIICREASRLTRRPREFEDLADRCEELNVRIMLDGREYDPADPDDRYMLASKAIEARRESDVTRRRVTKGSAHRATTGRPHTKLPFGYKIRFTETGAKIWEPDPDRAPMVRELADRLLAGDGLSTVARDWNQRKPRHDGKPWRAQALRAMIISPSYAGLRVHRGEVVGQGIWEPILTVDEHERIKALVSDRDRLTNKSRGCSPKWLLSGVARCSACGGAMRHTWLRRKDTPPSSHYRCGRGCVGRSQPDTDAHVIAEVLRAVRTWRANVVLFDLTEEYDDQGEPIGYAMPDGDYARIRGEVRELRQRLEGIKAEMIAGRIPAPDYADAREQIQPQIDALEDQARAELTNPLLLILAADPEQVWTNLDIADKRLLVKLTVDVRILPVQGRGRHGFDPEFVKVRSLLTDRERVGATLLRGVD